LMYLPVILSLVASCALIGGVFALWVHTRQSLRIEVASSICITVCVFAFLVEIQPIAAGNNDSGEVFPLVFLPGLWIGAHAILSRRKLKKISNPEVIPWQQ
jgi:drug/metabolite transporter superfamily protein YnfA